MIYSQIFHHSTVAEVQRNIVKWGKRSSISQLLHEKDDNKAIATWGSDLNGILHVINVRSVNSGWPLLTFLLQTELEIDIRADIRHGVVNTQAVVSDIHHDPQNPNNIVPDLHHDASSTHVVVPDIYCNTLKNRENTNSQNPTVSAHCTMHFSE